MPISFAKIQRTSGLIAINLHLIETAEETAGGLRLLFSGGRELVIDKVHAEDIKRQLYSHLASEV